MNSKEGYIMSKRIISLVLLLSLSALVQAGQRMIIEDADESFTYRNCEQDSMDLSSYEKVAEYVQSKKVVIRSYTLKYTFNEVERLVKQVQEQPQETRLGYVLDKLSNYRFNTVYQTTKLMIKPSICGDGIIFKAMIVYDKNGVPVGLKNPIRSELLEALCKNKNIEVHAFGAQCQQLDPLVS